MQNIIRKIRESITFEDFKRIPRLKMKKVKTRQKRIRKRIDVPSDHNSKILCFLFLANGQVFYNQRIGNDGDLLYSWTVVDLRNKCHGYWEYYERAKKILEANLMNPTIYPENPLATNISNDGKKNKMNMHVVDRHDNLIKTKDEHQWALEMNLTEFPTYEDLRKAKLLNRQIYQRDLYSKRVSNY